MRKILSFPLNKNVIYTRWFLAMDGWHEVKYYKKRIKYLLESVSISFVREMMINE